MEADTIDGMKHGPDPHYRRRRPAEIIGHAVWLYHVVTSTKSSSGFQGIQRFLWRTVETASCAAKPFATGLSDWAAAR